MIYQKIKEKKDKTLNTSPLWMSWADNSVTNRRYLPISNPKPDLHNINAHIKYGENQMRCTHVMVLKRNKWMCRGQIIVKIDEICRLAILNQIHLISMHLSSFVKIHWKSILKLPSGNENMDVSRADNSVENWRNLPFSHPKSDFGNINAYTKFGENPLIFT